MKEPRHPGFDDPFLDAEERGDFPRRRARRVRFESMTREEASEDVAAGVRNTLRKKPITVRVQERDIARIKAKALGQGIPYQTLVASILHRYARAAEGNAS